MLNHPDMQLWWYTVKESETQIIEVVVGCRLFNLQMLQGQFKLLLVHNLPFFQKLMQLITSD